MEKLLRPLLWTRQLSPFLLLLSCTHFVIPQCPGCGYGGLDMSQDLFQYFSSLDAGVISGDWEIGSGASQPTSTTPTTTYTPPPPTTTSTSSSTYTPPPTTSSTPTTTYTPTSTSTTSPPPTTSSAPSSTPTTTTTSSSSTVPSTNPTPTDGALEALTNAINGLGQFAQHVFA